MRYSKTPNIIPMVRNLGLFFTVIVAVVLSMFAAQYPSQDEPYVPALSSNYYFDKGKTTVEGLTNKIDNRALEFILNSAMPVLSPSRETTEQGSGSLLKLGLNLLSGVKIEDPLTYLKAEIPMMALVPVEPVTADSYDETEKDNITEPSPNSPESSNKTAPVENKITSEIPLIALYNTHTSETYELTDGLAHMKGKAGGIATVAREMQKTIEEKYKIPVTYSPVLHDLSFNKSYVESEKTVKQLLKDNPKLDMIFDVHRDGSMSREQSLVKINGKNVARILIVVGTNARAEHPKWRENLDFARKIAAKMDVMYPGLCRGVSIKQGRYNQQYSPHAILVEIGSSKNSTDEAVEGGRLFADVAVAVLNDLKN